LGAVNAIERARLRQASRIVKNGKKISKSDLMRIEAEDILKSHLFSDDESDVYAGGEDDESQNVQATSSQKSGGDAGGDESSGDKGESPGDDGQSASEDGQAEGETSRHQPVRTKGRAKTADSGSWQLAESNVARLRAPLDSPEMAGFVRALADVNWLADQSSGFVWRLRPDEGPVTMATLPGVGEVVLTLSVWTDFESLRQYVYRTAHGLFMQRRTRWFEPIGGFTTAMWWVREGHRPSAEEGVDQLVRLRTNGPSPRAFSLRRQFAADGSPH
jgi:hypothetical protein